MNPGSQEPKSNGRTLAVDDGWVMRRVSGVGIELIGQAPNSLPRLQQLLAWSPLFEPAWSSPPVQLIDDASSPTLLFDDPGGESLVDLLGDRWTVGSFLDMACAMALALAEMHSRGLLHQGLQPATFLLDTEHKRAWLTGFWHTTDMDGALKGPATPQHGLYCAPEQTGLMHRVVDQRSDLYALGACFYQMLTGEPPFDSEEPSQIVHAHLARMPVPVSTKVAHIPKPLSEIVSRLLAKAPESRYQTAAGLIADLHYCVDNWREHGVLVPMSLGQADIPAQLAMPNRLYGREDEVGRLLGLMEELAKGGRSRLALVSGAAGVGKSSLIRRAQASAVNATTRVLYAKSEPQLREVPYAVLVQALQGALNNILGLPDKELHAWRQALQRAVGSHGGLACALVPDLVYVLEPFAQEQSQAPSEQLALTQRMMQDLFQVFATPHEPLMLCIDDIQWLDAASLDLVDRFLGDTGVHSLLLVGTYRDQELTAGTALARCLPRWRRLEPAPAEIALRPLRVTELTRWLVDALRCKPSPAQGLACWRRWNIDQLCRLNFDQGLRLPPQEVSCG